MEGVALRQYMMRIAVINWLLSLFKANPELFTHRDLMDELAEWLWSDTCALEGCENLRLGMRADAFYCSHTCACRGWYKEHPDYWNEYGTPERRAAKYQGKKKWRQTPAGKASRVKSSKRWYAKKKAAKLAALS